jgi:hypothetical protein
MPYFPSSRLFYELGFGNETSNASPQSVFRELGGSELSRAAEMERQITNLCHKIMENWHEATAYDYAFTTAWIVIVGFLVAKMNSGVAR